MLQANAILFEICYKSWVVNGAFCEVKHRFENLSSSTGGSQASLEKGWGTNIDCETPDCATQAQVLNDFPSVPTDPHTRAFHFCEGRMPALFSHLLGEREVLRSQTTHHEAPS